LITEDKGKVIKNMIDKHGLFNTIKMVGKYEPIHNTIGHEYFTNENKIDFIKDSVQHLTKPYNTTGISIYELGMNPVTFGTPDPYGLEFQYIEYFNVDFVKIYVYDKDSHRGDFREEYEDLDDDTLDNVFIFMIDALEKFL
jgi:hypothetical protein